MSMVASNNCIAACPSTSLEPSEAPVSISLGSKDGEERAIWLLIHEESDDASEVSGKQHHENSIPGKLVSSSLNANGIGDIPDIQKVKTCIKLSGGLEELRDALNTHLHPRPSLAAKDNDDKYEVQHDNNDPLQVLTHPATSTPQQRRHPSRTTASPSAGYRLPLSPISPRSSVYYPKELDALKRFELFRKVVEHEDNLLNQRVEWIILAQSFLMAAFISSSSSSTNNSNALRYVTASVGLATVLVTLPAIIAAGRNIEVQQRVYFNGLESDEQCLALHGHVRDLSRNALPNFDETKTRETHGHIFPNTAFRGKHSLPILSTVVALCAVQFAGWCFLLLVLVLDW